MNPPWLSSGWLAGAAHDLFVHLLHRPRNFIRNLFDLDVLHHVLDFCGDTVAARDCFAKGDRFADNPEVGAARTAEFQISRRLDATLGTEHNRLLSRVIIGGSQPEVKPRLTTLSGVELFWEMSKKKMPQVSSRHLPLFRVEPLPDRLI